MEISAMPTWVILPVIMVVSGLIALLMGAIAKADKPATEYIEDNSSLWVDQTKEPGIVKEIICRALKVEPVAEQRTIEACVLCEEKMGVNAHGFKQCVSCGYSHIKKAPKSFKLNPELVEVA